MKPQFSPAEFASAKGFAKLPLMCCQCGSIFFTSRVSIQQQISHPERNRLKFCGRKCLSEAQNKTRTLTCTNCKVPIKRKFSQFKKSKNHFCSRSCAASWNNLHKQKGTRVSKLEIFLQKELSVAYPERKFLFNDKTAIDSELDIYIPDIALAFELNGPTHYKPLFGLRKFASIQQGDAKKVHACRNYGIALYTLNVSGMNKFSKSQAIPFLKKIQKIIDSNSELVQ